jgi:hypothetical protein
MEHSSSVQAGLDTPVLVDLDSGHRRAAFGAITIAASHMHGTNVEKKVERFVAAPVESHAVKIVVLLTETFPGTAEFLNAMSQLQMMCVLPLGLRSLWLTVEDASNIQVSA